MLPKVLNISDKHPVTTEDVLWTIQVVYGEYDKHLTLIKKWKLLLPHFKFFRLSKDDSTTKGKEERFCLISSSFGLAKTILQQSEEKMRQLEEEVGK